MFWRGHNHLAGCKCRCGELQLQVWGPAIAVGGGCICSLGGLQLQPDRLQVQLQMQLAQLHGAFTRAALCSRAGCTVQSGTGARLQMHSLGPLHGSADRCTCSRCTCS